MPRNNLLLDSIMPFIDWVRVDGEKLRRDFSEVAPTLDFDHVYISRDVWVVDIVSFDTWSDGRVELQFQREDIDAEDLLAYDTLYDWFADVFLNDFEDTFFIYKSAEDWMREDAYGTLTDEVIRLEDISILDLQRKLIEDEMLGKEARNEVTRDKTAHKHMQISPVATIKMTDVSGGRYVTMLKRNDTGVQFVGVYRTSRDAMAAINIPVEGILLTTFKGLNTGIVWQEWVTETGKKYDAAVVFLPMDKVVDIFIDAVIQGPLKADSCLEAIENFLKND